MEDRRCVYVITSKLYFEPRDEIMLVSAENMKSFALNKTAWWLLEHCAGFTPDELIDKFYNSLVMNKSNTPSYDEVATACLECMKEMRIRGLVVLSDEPLYED